MARQASFRVRTSAALAGASGWCYSFAHAASGCSYLDAGRFASSQAKAVIAQSNLHRIAQRCEADYFNILSFEQTHLPQPLTEEVVTQDCFNRAPMARTELIQRRHRRKTLGDEAKR
jgi:hypothetical protein